MRFSAVLTMYFAWSKGNIVIHHSIEAKKWQNLEVSNSAFCTQKPITLQIYTTTLHLYYILKDVLLQPMDGTNNGCTPIQLQWDEKIPARPRFSRSNFAGFSRFSQEPVVVQKWLIYHWKALIFSCYEPKYKGAWWPDMTAMPSGMKP